MQQSGEESDALWSDFQWAAHQLRGGLARFDPVGLGHAGRRPSGHASLERPQRAGREAAQLKERVTTLKVAVQAIDKVLRVLGHDGPLTSPQRAPNTAGLFGPRELSHLIAEVLREATTGLSTRVVTAAVMRLKGWDADDVRFERAERKGRVPLYKRRKREAVRIAKRGGENVWWSVASAAQLPQ